MLEHRTMMLVLESDQQRNLRNQKIKSQVCYHFPNNLFYNKKLSVIFKFGLQSFSLIKK